MKQVLYKLFLGKPEYNKPIKESAYAAYRKNLLRIWNNERHHDIGFEKVIRLFLVWVQLFFPGIHVRALFRKAGLIKRNVAVEVFVLFKTCLPLFFMFSGLYKHMAAIVISCYMLAETLLYVSSLIFVADIFVKPRSYRRNILMLSFNYLEISFCFAVLYAGLHLLGDKPQSIIDYIYFSIVTSTTVGYGDLHPVTDAGKILVCIQALIVVAFIVLFLNFFGSKVETLGGQDE